MADQTPIPLLKDLSNPFNLRRLRWHDSQGRVCTSIVGVLEVEERVKALGAAGVKVVQVDRLSWTQVYVVTPPEGI